MAFASYQSATRCTGSATPGARALMAWILDNVDGARNLGIYNCRTVRGGSTTSLHGEGRACDVGMPMSGGRATRAGHNLVDLLAENAARLGIQAIIYDREIWSARSPGGRRYNGVHPHYDHLHIELNRSGASRLTLATIRSVLSGGKEQPKEQPKPDKAKGGSGKWAGYDHVPGSRTLKKGSRSDAPQGDVAFLQRWIGDRCGKADGIFGPKTDAGVRSYQKDQGLKVDGIVGKQTWGRILEHA